MLAFSLPIALGYTVGLTAASWVAGVLVFAIALNVASHGELTWRSLASGALAMDVGICGMHYTGVAAARSQVGLSPEFKRAPQARCPQRARRSPPARP